MILRLIKQIPASCALAFCIYIPLVLAESNIQTGLWQLIKEKQGIQVYTQAVPGSSLLKVKTQVTIKSSIPHIQSILDNAQHRKNWIPFLNHSSVKHVFSATDKLEYSHFHAPWPASDRDFVYRISLTHQDNSRLIYQMKSELYSVLPENKGIIRAELIESIYTLSKIDEQHTRVELIFHADPKGWLPAWIINIIQKTLPYMILRNLRIEASKQAV